MGFLTIVVLSALFLCVFLPKRKIMNKFIIIRGIPGSGKSTLAKQIAAANNTDYSETDQFLYNEKGEYEWTQERHSHAIDLHHELVSEKFRNKDPMIIVTGVYTRWRAIRDYVEMAQECGYEVQIIQVNGDYGSIHNLDAEKMEEFRKRFIPNSQFPHEHGIIYREHP